ncbi:MAG: NusG domain II-containing protein [Oscillospiraceae bacterium]|nr:NusG domain II-containing protein [Oscillospiraceae bacterium]
MDWLKTHKNDVILIAALLMLGGALALFLLFIRQTGGRVLVQVDGETVMELPLSEDTRTVLGEDGRSNTLVVENGAARVVEADCPDQVCVRHGAVRYAGESIVCLPHRLIVTIEGGAENGVDGIA